MERYLSIIIVCFMIVGIFDKIVLKGKLGLGKEFERGFYSVGTLILSMAGIMCVAPVLGHFLARVAAPLFNILGADPAMIAGVFFAIDMGGLPLASAMTESSAVQILSGVILSSTMGATIVFLIPVSMTLCRETDLGALSKGIVLGVISIPFGMLAGAAVAKIPFSVFLINSIPIIAVCILLTFFLLQYKDKTLACFKIFGSSLQVFCIISLGLAAIEEVLGIIIIPGMDKLGTQLETIGIIGITLAGAYPMLAILTYILSPVLERAAQLLKINQIAVEGMIAALANPIPLLEKVKEMDERGKVIAVAFAVPVTAVFGDHLGYVSATMPNAMMAMITAKLTAGIVAIVLAEIFESAADFKGKIK